MKKECCVGQERLALAPPSQLFCVTNAPLSLDIEINFNVNYSISDS